MRLGCRPTALQGNLDTPEVAEAGPRTAAVAVAVLVDRGKIPRPRVEAKQAVLVDRVPSPVRRPITREVVVGVGVTPAPRQVEQEVPGVAAAEETTPIGQLVELPIRAPAGAAAVVAAIQSRHFRITGVGTVAPVLSSSATPQLTRRVIPSSRRTLRAARSTAS